MTGVAPGDVWPVSTGKLLQKLTFQVGFEAVRYGAVRHRGTERDCSNAQGDRSVKMDYFHNIEELVTAAADRITRVSCGA